MTMIADKQIASQKIAVLPLGATEQHGPHLPAETDWIIAEAIAIRALADLDLAPSVALIPVEKTGYSIEHADHAATQSLNYDEAIDRWIAAGEAAQRQGISKLVMLNAHGGNSPLMTIVATELRVRFNMLAVATSWTRFGYPKDLVPDEVKALDIHGGFIETSVMLALRPDLVDMSKAGDFPNAQEGFAQAFQHLRAYGPHAFGWKMSDLSPDGVTGNAAAATAETGERILAHAVTGFRALLADVARFDVSQLR
ncbi:MAG: creatininase family protein [Rhizobiaceae bacterium]|nr:creatininase family protein [Rhizobiaceae bacterium]